MAVTWTDPQITSLSRIFATGSVDMSAWLAFYDSVITTADQTAVLADITAYEAVESDNVEVEANLKNFGAHVSADKKRSLIKKRIAGLIHWETSSGSGLVRG